MIYASVTKSKTERLDYVATADGLLQLAIVLT